MRLSRALCWLFILTTAVNGSESEVDTQATPLKSRAELSNYEETSRLEDVLRFFGELQQRSPLVHVESFGRSYEGRELPLVILSQPLVTQSSSARKSRKPVVFVLANIHAGEVEGKEAAQHLARRLALGDLRPMLDKLIVLIAPVYNADGNERISMTNRASQNGPIGGVGRRENAQGLDLNRDFMKMDAPETQSLIRLVNLWDPQVTVDLHTTDGSYHGYHLTYSIPLNPSLDEGLTDYHRKWMMPALTEAMRTRHDFRTYYYGNFSNAVPESASADGRVWLAFSPQPRVGVNYFGFRNRLSILSEAYSYLGYRRRIAVTEAFVEEILRFTAGHAEEIRRVTEHMDAEMARRSAKAPPRTIGVEYKPKQLTEPAEILVGEITKVKNPRSGREMRAMVEDKFTPVKMLDLGEFEATRTVPIARAYVFRDEDGLRGVRDKLLAHGIKVEQLMRPTALEVETLQIVDVRQEERRFQGHHETTLQGGYETKKLAFPKGSLVVRTAQPLGLLAAYLLEPESNDGLATWNFLDACLEPGKEYPVYKLMQNVNLKTAVVEH
jgi:hypothetical protein